MTQDKKMKKSLLPEPTEYTETISLHFRVQGEFMTDLAIQSFWFEDSEKRGKKILDSFPLLTEKQKNKILWGYGRMAGMSICDNPECFQCKGETNPLHYEDGIQKETRKIIVQRMKWLNKNYFKMGEFHVRKESVYAYLGEIKLYQELSDGSSESALEKIEKNVVILYNSIFQSVTQLPPTPVDVPKVGTRRYEFAVELEKFMQDKKEELLKSDEVKDRFDERIEDLKQERLARIVYNSQSRPTKSKTPEKEESTEKSPFTLAEIVASPKIEMTLESGKKLQVPQILLDEYANSVRYTRASMILKKPLDMSIAGIMASQRTLDTRINLHKEIYKSVGIVYHLEHEYFKKKSEEQFPDPKGQEFFRKMTDEERESLEFNVLIQEYVEKKYPDISMKSMFGKTDDENVEKKE